MRLIPLSILLISLCFWDSVLAHSGPARPLKRLYHLSTQALEILPRQQSPHDKRSTPSRSPILSHSDSFRLTISAFHDTFHLHLRPNDHLIHPAARINHYRTTPDGKSVLSHTEPLLRESVKAYMGEVIPAEFSSSRMREDAAGVYPSADRHPQLGWARIMVHHQGSPDEGIAPLFEGAFSVNGIVHHIMTRDNYLRNKQPLDPDIALPLDDMDSHLVIWRDSDVMKPHEEHAAKTKTPGFSGHAVTQPQSCAHDSLAYNTDPLLNAALQKPIGNEFSWYDPLGTLKTSFGKRDDVAGAGIGTNFVDSIGDTAACPKSQKVLYMGVASDCMYTAKYGSTGNATTQILQNWNTASSLYKNTFNVSLGIIELQVHSEVCPSPVSKSELWNVDCSSVNLNERLSLFSDWRGQKGNDGAGLWHLMSGCPTGTEVGIAWLATLCVQISGGSSPSIVSGTAVSTAGRTEWQIVAHEIGHNFGAIHDCTDGCNGTTSCCPLSAGSCDTNSKFIMSPVAEAGEMNFSPCSLGNICTLMKGVTGSKTNTTCLVDPDPNVKSISLQMCGNGIVEKGEDCDPGKGTTSSCCDPATCKFLPDARCDPASSPCCTTECTFAPPTRVCRPTRDSSCDTAEMCTGNSSACPADIFSPNGKSCGSSGLACASGQCTSVSKQCQSVGSSMNLQQACPNRGGDDTCQISCQDPTRANTCVVLQSILIDGSPCGYGGICSAGNCQPGSLLDKAKSWYLHNLQISIPVSVVAGLALLVFLWGVIMAIRRCSIRAPKISRASLGSQRLASFDHSAMVGPPISNRVSQAPVSRNRQPRSYIGNPGGFTSSQFPSNPPPTRTQWVDASLYNGSRG